MRSGDSSDTDFVLGALLHVHSEDPTQDGGRCGAIRDDEELEAMLFAIDTVNADGDLLPGIKLGYDVRDTCYSENIALDETVDLIIAGSNFLPESCVRATTVGGETGGSVAGANNSSQNSGTILGIIGAEASRVSRPVASLTRLFQLPQISPASSSPSLSNRDRYTYFFRTIPPDDLQARAMVELMTFYNWTHFSTIYSNDDYGRGGIEELHNLASERGMCLDLNMAIEDDFVESDYRRIVETLYGLGNENDVAGSDSDSTESTGSDSGSTGSDSSTTTTTTGGGFGLGSSVAVLFTHEQNARLLYEEVATLEPAIRRNRTVVFIGSEAWARSISTISSLNEVSAGYFGVSPAVEYSDTFYNDYLTRLTLQSNKRNAWFPEFFSSLAGGCDHSSSSDDFDGGAQNGTSDSSTSATATDGTETTMATGASSTTTTAATTTPTTTNDGGGDGDSVFPCDRSLNIFQLNRTHEMTIFGSQTIDAVYAFAHALNDFLIDNCDAIGESPYVWTRQNGTCVGQRAELTGSALLGYVQNVSFTSPTGNEVSFDENGNIRRKYEILNFQYKGQGQYALERVAVWKSDLNLLIFNKSMDVQFGIVKQDTDVVGGDDYLVIGEAPVSQCNLCRPGEYLVPVTSACCGTCQACLGDRFSNGTYSTSCSSCTETFGPNYWGDDPTIGSDDCVEIETYHLEFSHPWSVIVVLLSIFGILCVAATAIVVGVKWGTPIVKSSGREQIVLLLCGISLSFVLPIFYIAPPTLGVCVVQRVGIWVCVSLTFGAILVKVVRVYRIFVNAEKMKLKRVRFTGPLYQVLFTFLIVGGQIMILAISIGVRIPGVESNIRRNQEDSNDFPTNVLTCVADHPALLGISIAYEGAVVLSATVLGVLSFKYPKNFNEARFISFCTFALLLIWLTFVPSYFTASFRVEFQSAVIAMATLMTAYAELLCLFGQKVYIMILHPGSNVASNTTHHQQQTYDVQQKSKISNTLVVRNEKSTAFLTVGGSPKIPLSTIRYAKRDSDTEMMGVDNNAVTENGKE